MRHILATAINTMPEREKIVLTLYYYESLTLAEIGLVLGVTESRVCQIHTKAVLHLRARLSASERELRARLIPSSLASPAITRVMGGAHAPSPLGVHGVRHGVGAVRHSCARRRRPAGVRVRCATRRPSTARSSTTSARRRRDGQRATEASTTRRSPAKRSLASADGTVEFAGQVGGTLHVVVKHADGLRTSYSFLASVSVIEGQQLARGTPVGRAGASVHFGVRLGDTYLDPELVLEGRAFGVRLVPVEGPDRSRTAARRDGARRVRRRMGRRRRWWCARRCCGLVARHRGSGRAVAFGRPLHRGRVGAGAHRVGGRRGGAVVPTADDVHARATPSPRSRSNPSATTSWCSSPGSGRRASRARASTGSTSRRSASPSTG